MYEQNSLQFFANFKIRIRVTNIKSVGTEFEVIYRMNARNVLKAKLQGWTLGKMGSVVRGRGDCVTRLKPVSIIMQLQGYPLD